jgi:hypothetical protein
MEIPGSEESPNTHYTNPNIIQPFDSTTGNPYNEHQ